MKNTTDVFLKKQVCILLGKVKVYSKNTENFHLCQIFIEHKSWLSWPFFREFGGVAGSLFP